MKILITGGCGFIGSHVLDFLVEKGYKELTILDVWKNEYIDELPVQFVKASILDEKKLIPLMKKSDVVVHLAGILGTSETIFKYAPYKVAETNIIGTSKILHFAHKFNVKRILFASTPNVPWLNPYKITKSTSEKFIDIYRKHYKSEVVLFRFRNVYGPRERWLKQKTSHPYIYQKVVPTFIYRALMNNPIPIFGDGTQQSDYIYVRDIAKCVEAGINSDLASLYHHIPIGTGTSLSVNQVADAILSLIETKSEKEYLPMRQGEMPLSISTDTSIMTEALNINPLTLTDLGTGLIKTIEWIREQICE